MGKSVVPVGKEMERFVPTEVFREKSNTFQGITCFSVSPTGIFVPFGSRCY